MKKFFASVLLSASLFQSQAALTFYDSFNYTPTGAQVSTAGAPSWSLRFGSVDPTIASGSLSYPGLQTASGDNSVLFNGVAPAAGISTRALGQVYNIVNAPTMYYSLTFQVSSITAADWGTPGNALSGSFMMGFSENTSGALANPSTAAPLLIRTGDPLNLSGTNNDFQGFQLGTGVTSVTGPPSSRVFDGTRTYNPGDTLFLVLSYTFVAGASNDVARLYVNPIPGSLESANTPVVVTATGVADVTNSQIQAFFLRNNSVEPAGTLIDDLRVGDAWADVAPAAVPEPSTIAFLGIGALALMLTRRFRR